MPNPFFQLQINQKDFFVKPSIHKVIRHINLRVMSIFYEFET